MAWVTTKDGRHVNTEWFEDDKEEGKKREHTPLSEQKKSKLGEATDEIRKKEREKVSLDKIKSYGYDPADATGDPTIINADGESYYKVGENKWKRHASSGRVLSDSISDEKLAETLKDAQNIKVMPSQKKNAKSLTDQMKEAKNKPDLSSRGTYNLKGEKAPEDLPRVSDEEAKQNKQIEYDGTTYSTQQVVDYDKSQGGEYVAGHMYVPHNDLNKGSFFVSKDGEMYHSGSDYLNAKAKKSLTDQMKEANNEKPKREHEFKKKDTGVTRKDVEELTAKKDSLKGVDLKTKPITPEEISEAKKRMEHTFKKKEVGDDLSKMSYAELNKKHFGLRDDQWREREAIEKEYEKRYSKLYDKEFKKADFPMKADSFYWDNFEKASDKITDSVIKEVSKHKTSQFGMRMAAEEFIKDMKQKGFTEGQQRDIGEMLNKKLTAKFGIAVYY